jgi:hypothetical protein
MWSIGRVASCLTPGRTGQTVYHAFLLLPQARLAGGRHSQATFACLGPLQRLTPQAGPSVTMNQLEASGNCTWGLCTPHDQENLSLNRSLGIKTLPVQRSRRRRRSRSVGPTPKVRWSCAGRSSPSRRKTVSAQLRNNPPRPLFFPHFILIVTAMTKDFIMSGAALGFGPAQTHDLALGLLLLSRL